MDNRPSRHRLVRIRSSRCEPPDQRRLSTREIGGALVRIGLLTEGGYPYVSGDARLWCDRLVRGLEQHEFDIYALSRSERQEDEGWVQLPPQVGRVITAPLWTAPDDGVVYGRRARRRFAESYGELAAALCEGGVGDASGELSAAEADRFASALYGLAELARDEGGLVGALRSETAVRALERACRAPGARQTAREARVPDLLAVAAHLERALRPLSLDWYEDDGLGAVDLCHAASGGPAALPGLLAHHFCGVPLLVTEYGVRLRTHYLADTDSAPAVRALLAAFHGRLATETYRRAAVVTPGNTHARRWQERCGADREKLRTVYPGMDAARFTEVGESAECGDPDRLVWVGRVEPAKDLISLLHAFAEIRKEEPKTRLRIVGAPTGPEGAAYLGHCKALAAQLFPDEAEGLHAVGDNPVSFEEIGGPEVPTLADAYASGAVTVLSSVVEGFPISLVEAMFCGRATVSTDVGAVVEVIGGTGLVVPPRNPKALAEACVTLLRDPERRERLGAAARARALELFTVEQNITAFHGIYLEIVSHTPVRRVVLDDTGEPLPFAAPAEAHVPGHWTELSTRVVARGGPGWAAGPPVHATPPFAATEGASG
ncbi:glycosyltransferase involved in cell wall biosynthesis [Streptomyces canus]|nr:glycosyltransferase involved in cell wall biosynthesis [Streptomyces canus]MDQ1067790.1 glycosyltransferase involved in cell wall biosynthesis [Streptomyces canus]